MKRKVCIITGTRAEWGLLSGIARELNNRTDITLQIVATNMHLNPLYGYTVDEIIADGFEVNFRVPMSNGDDSSSHKTKAMATCLSGMADAFASLRPDIVVILGDRYEMLAVASAAIMNSIPIVHLHGGEITEGAIDDSIRHAITKMSALHLTSTEEYRQRVIQMGEQPHLVINTGAIGVYNSLSEPIIPHDELEQSIGCKLNNETILLTYHPVTLDSRSPAELFNEVLKALDNFPNSNILITYPNNDARGEKIITLITNYQQNNPDRVTVYPTLGKRRYLSALHYVGVVAGNSSSGIIEVPSVNIPTVNIGIRQQGRIAATSVINCGDSAEEITDALTFALSTQGQTLAKETTNPYYQPNTLNRIVNAIATTPLSELSPKHFYDINI